MRIKFIHNRIVKILFLAAFIVVGSSSLSIAQFNKLPRFSHKPFQYPKTVKEFIKYNPTIFELGWTVVDDDGKPWKNLFAFRKSWNVRPYPSRIALDKQVSPHWYIGLAFTYNVYKNGKIINNNANTVRGRFFSVDYLTKYDFNELIDYTGWFDPYLTIGFGYTNRMVSISKNTFNANVGAGAHFWFYDEMLGLSLQTQAKVGIHAPFIRNETNYMQHSFGIVFKTRKGLNTLLKARWENYKKRTRVF